MLLRPSEHKLWDTTLVHDGSYFQLLYIAGNGILGRARSTNLVSWESLPPLDLHGPEGSWNENGLICNTVVRRDGEWCLIAGGDGPNGEWQMGLFTSPDFENWTPHPENPILTADGDVYTKGPNAIHSMHPAWRDPCIWQDEEGWWRCLMCARRPSWDHTSTGAVVAHLRSRDLIAWEVLPPLAEVGERFLFCEVPSYFTLNGRHYLTFLDLGWGGTREHTPSRDDACGTFYLWADDFEGPWHWPKDSLLLGADDQCMASWAAKALQHEGRVLLYSHIASSGQKASLALTKEVVEREPGVLELRYIDQLTSLEAVEVVKPGEALEFSPRPNDSGLWLNSEAVTLRGRADGCGTAATIARDMGDFHLEATVTLERGSSAGLVLRATQCEEKFLINGAPPKGVGIMLDLERGLLEMRGVFHVPMHGWGVCFMQSRQTNYSAIRRQRVRVKLEHNRPYRLRVITRAEFFEVYLDDVWQITVAQPESALIGDVELVAERATALFSELRLARLS